MTLIPTDLRKINEPWVVRTFFLKPGEKLPKGWQLVYEDYAIKEDAYITAGKTRHQPIVVRKTS